jgi:hypothetical protein
VSAPLKNPTPWTPSTKSDTGWTPSTKNPTTFESNGVAEIPYLYDSATQTYDDATRAYDYLTFAANQLNQANPTGWTATA